jgi:hypothetical protein
MLVPRFWANTGDEAAVISTAAEEKFVTIAERRTGSSAKV